MIWLTSFKFNIVTTDQVPGDLASQYNDFLLTEEVLPGTKLLEGDLMIKQNGQLVRPVRLPNGLYKFRFGLFSSERNRSDWFPSPGREQQRIGWFLTA